MEIKARLNYLRIAPRKVRLVANLIKGKSVIWAKNNLEFLLKKSAIPMLKTLNSAVNNAKNKFNLNENDLYIKSCIVNEGYKFKRWMPRAFGRAAMIKKRTSKIEIILDTIEQRNILPAKKEKNKKIKQETEIKENIQTENKKDTKKDKKIRMEKVLGKKGVDIKRKIFQRKAI